MNKTEEVTQRWIDYGKGISPERREQIARASLIMTMNFRWDFGDSRLSAALAALVDNMELAAGYEANVKAARDLDIWSMKEDGSLFLEALRLFDSAVPDEDGAPVGSRYRKELVRAMKKGAQHAVQSQA